MKYQNVKTVIETSKTLLEDSDNSDIIGKIKDDKCFQEINEVCDLLTNDICYSYTFDKEVGLHDTIFNDMYLYAIGKYYRGATI